MSPARGARPARFSSHRLLGPMLFLGFVLALWPTRALRSDSFVFYLPKTHHVLPVEVIEHTKYLPLLQVLNVFGKVEGWSEKRKTAKAWFGDTELEFHQDEKDLRMNKVWVTLTDPVRFSNGQWVVPVDFLTSALPRIIHQTVRYQVGSNRIFFGSVKSSTFTVRLDELSNGARLTLQFTDKVSVRTASQNGQWVMYLGEGPVEPLEPNYSLHNPYLRELRFDDQDGVPKLILVPSESGLNFYPVLAEGGKVLLADVVKPPGVQVAQNPSAQPPTAPPATAPQPSPPGPTPEAPAAPLGPPLPVVVLDAGHGGPDSGARSRDGVLEKDLVAQLVTRVRVALLEMRKFRVLLTRSGDTSPTFEQRETTANVARPVCFITFHAGPSAPGAPHVAVYVYRDDSPPASGPPAAAGPPQKPSGLFVPWMQVQDHHLERSRQMAQALFLQLAQVRPGGPVPDMVVDSPVEAPVRVLRSVDAPAVALEIGSLSPENDSGALTNPDLQQRIANAVSKALEEFHGRTS